VVCSLLISPQRHCSSTALISSLFSRHWAELKTWLPIALQWLSKHTDWLANHSAAKFSSPLCCTELNWMPIIYSATLTDVSSLENFEWLFGDVSLQRQLSGSLNTPGTAQWGSRYFDWRRGARRTGDAKPPFSAPSSNDKINTQQHNNPKSVSFRFRAQISHPHNTAGKIIVSCCLNWIILCTSRI
jgi:hypothetical protein